jgi:hypothetical protein
VKWRYKSPRVLDFCPAIERYDLDHVVRLEDADQIARLENLKEVYFDIICCSNYELDILFAGKFSF